MPRMWFIPHKGDAYFDNKSINHVACKYTEGLSLSSTLSLLYNIEKSTSNRTLSKYGYILSDIPGDAVLIDETGDIDINIKDTLYSIVKKDNDMRNEYIDSFSEMLSCDR